MKYFKGFIIVFLITLYSCSDNDQNDPLIIEEEEELIDIYKPDNSFKVVGYFPYYRFSSVDSIDFKNLTYVNIAFGNLNSSGNIEIGDGILIRNIVDKIKTDNPAAKVLISLAGGAISDTQISNWVKYLSENNRRNTIISMVNFVETNNLDGIDVDIEGSLLPFIGANYNNFVIELKDRLHAKGKAITAALMPISLDPVISNNTLKAFDFINIMAYNASGLWNISNPGPHSSFEFAEESIDFWMITNNISAHKLVLGMPFYGINFDPDFAGYTTYGEIVAEDPDNAYVDNVDLIYYNGIPTIVKKTELAMEKVSGIMVWELGQDAFNDLSLVKAANQVLAAAPCDGKPITTYYADEDGDGYGNKERPFQACEQPMGYVENRTDADDTNPEIH